MVKDVQISVILKEGKLNGDTIFNLSYWKTNLNLITPNIDIDVRENWHSCILSYNIYISPMDKGELLNTKYF